MRTWVQSLASLSGLRVQRYCGCGVGRRNGLDLGLLWLGCRLAAAALIGLLAWEPPHAKGAPLKRHTHTNQAATQGWEAHSSTPPHLCLDNLDTRGLDQSPPAPSMDPAGTISSQSPAAESNDLSLDLSGK